MADDDKPAFDPSAPFTAAPAAEKPAFDPSKPFEAAPEKKPTPGLLGNIYEAGHSALSAINDTLNPFSEGVRKRHEEASKQPFFSPPSDLMPVGRGLAAIPELAASPITGTVKTGAPYVADLEARVIQGVGEPIARALNPNAVLPSRETIAHDIEPQVETALGLVSPRKAVPGPAPPRPAPGPLGVTLSKGQETGDLSAIQREQAALRGTSGTPAQRVAQAFADQQETQLAAAHGDIAQSLDTLGQQIIAAGPQEAGELVSAGVEQAAKSAKAGVKTAYDTARGLPGEIHADVFRDMNTGIRADLSGGTNPVIVDDRLTPYASRMLKDIDDRVSQLRIQNQAALSSPVPRSIVGVNLEGVDQMRKRLSSMRRDAYASGNAADGRAAQAVIDAFDARIDSAVNGGMFTGDARAVQAWNDARAAYADYRQTFTGSKNDPIGRVVEKIIGDRTTVAKTGNDVADHLFGTSGVNPSSLNVGVANRVKTILGEQSPEWVAARQGLFSRLTETPPGVKDWGPGKVANRLNEFLNGGGKEMSRVVFSPQERVTLQRYADLMRQLEVPQAGANWSNTATFLQKIGNQVTSNMAALFGGGVGHLMGLPYVGELAGAAVGKGAAKMVGKIGEASEARAVSGQMPLVTDQLKKWQQAVARAQRNTTPSARLAVTAASTQLGRSLEKLGVNLPSVAVANPEQNQDQVPRPPGERNDGGGVGHEQGRAQGGHVATLRAHGGRVNADADKRTHESVHYVATSKTKGERCGACSMFQRFVKNGPACSQVQRPIAAAGHCVLFAREEPSPRDQDAADLSSMGGNGCDRFLARPNGSG